MRDFNQRMKAGGRREVEEEGAAMRGGECEHLEESFGRREIWTRVV